MAFGRYLHGMVRDVSVVRGGVSWLYCVLYVQLRTRKKKAADETELVDMRPPGVGGIEVEAPQIADEGREARLDQPSKVTNSCPVRDDKGFTVRREGHFEGYFYFQATQPLTRVCSYFTLSCAFLLRGTHRHEFGRDASPTGYVFLSPL